MTIGLDEHIFNPTLSLKYVLVYEKEAMLSSSHEVTKGDLFEDCLDCGGDSPPPDFFLPPPPCSADLGFGDDSWSCPAMMEPKDYRTEKDGRISVAVVVVTAVTFVILAIVAALIIYRRRRYHASQDSKGNPPIAGSAIIYDDLTPQIVQQQARTASINGHPNRQNLWPSILSNSPPRYVYRPPMTCASRGHYARRSRDYMGKESPTSNEPLYHTISSGSESRGSCCFPEEVVHLKAPPPHLLSCEPDEDDSLTPFLKKGEVNTKDNDSGQLRQDASYYLSVPVSSYFPPPTPSSLEYEALPLRGNHLSNNDIRGSPTPREKGLPPLPSRSERFRMFLPSDRERPMKPSRTSSPPQEISYQRPPGANTVLYENVGLSSHL